MTSETLELTFIETMTFEQRDFVRRLLRDRSLLSEAFRRSSHEISLLRHVESHIRAWINGESELDQEYLDRLFNTLDGIRG